MLADGIRAVSMRPDAPVDCLKTELCLCEVCDIWGVLENKSAKRPTGTRAAPGFKPPKRAAPPSSSETAKTTSATHAPTTEQILARVHALAKVQALADV
jgi:hypothetical protein